MKKLLLPLAGACVALAAPAHADTQGFFNYMQNHGYTSTVSAGNGLSYLDQGQQVCHALQSGASESSQIGRLEGLMSRAESGLVVQGARQYLCPGA